MLGFLTQLACINLLKVFGRSFTLITDDLCTTDSIVTFSLPNKNLQRFIIVQTVWWAEISVKLLYVHVETFVIIFFGTFNCTMPGLTWHCGGISSNFAFWNRITYAIPNVSLLQELFLLLSDGLHLCHRTIQLYLIMIWSERLQLLRTLEDLNFVVLLWLHLVSYGPWKFRHPMWWDRVRNFRELSFLPYILLSLRVDLALFLKTVDIAAVITVWSVIWLDV